MRISDWSSDVCSSDLPLLAAGRRGLGLEPRLDRRILRIEMREVGDKVLDHVHRRQRGDRDVALQILDRGGAGEAVLAVHVHRTAAADALAARAAESQRRILLALHLDARVEHNRAAFFGVALDRVENGILTLLWIVTLHLKFF